MAKHYRCFFCEEVFKTQAEAYEHFGDASPCGSDIPACVDPLRTDEKERMKELRIARAECLRLMHQEERADEFEWQLREFEKNVRHFFGDDCTSLWSAGDRYSNLLFALKMAREEIEALKNGTAVEVANG